MNAPSSSAGRRRTSWWRRLRFEHRLLVFAFLVALPGMAVAVVSILRSDLTSGPRWTLLAALLLAWLVPAMMLRSHIATLLRTLSSLLESLRAGDYLHRPRHDGLEDVLSEVFREFHLLAEALSNQRLRVLESSTLLRTVMSEIDVAVLAFDPERALRLINRAGERLLGSPAKKLIGRTAKQLHLDDLLSGELPPTVERAFPGGTGRWGLRRSVFRSRGVQHHLLVVTDLSRSLRREERKAWQRIIRVMGHELNNSLTPITSTAATLEQRLGGEADGEALREDLERGLGLIRSRASRLGRFVQRYSQLARIPAPTLAMTSIPEVMREVVALETRLEVEIGPVADATAWVDRGQLEQVLINLVRNAVDAVVDEGGRVAMRSFAGADELVIEVLDDGPGIADCQNLFVPFYTTKPNGSGIGLVLSQQIAEAHGGSVSLENRRDGPGCLARLSLPLGQQTAAGPGHGLADD